MLAWWFGKEEKSRAAIMAPAREPIVIAGETFPQEGPENREGIERLKRLGARFQDLKSLLAQHESSLAAKQETIAKLDEKIRMLDHKVDAQTTLVERYRHQFECMPGRIAAFLAIQAQEIDLVPMAIDHSLRLNSSEPS